MTPSYPITAVPVPVVLHQKIFWLTDAAVTAWCCVWLPISLPDIYLAAEGGRPEIVMPPLSPPPECEPHLEIRDDDIEQVVLKRLQVKQT
jgi:hypothetical protein